MPRSSESSTRRAVSATRRISEWQFYSIVAVWTWLLKPLKCQKSQTSKDDEPCVRKLIADGDHGLYTAYVWKPELDESDIGFVLTKKINRLTSGGSLCNQQHVWLSIDNAGNSDAPQGMVINGQHPDLLAHTSSIRETSSRIASSEIVSLSLGSLATRFFP